MLAGRTRRRRHALPLQPPDPEAVARQVHLDQRVLLQRLEQWVKPPTLPADPSQLCAEHVPRVQTVEEQLLTAARIDRFIHDKKPVLPCAVCSCAVGRADVAEESCLVADLPGLELLRADLPPTEELPRAGLTHVIHGGAKYCL